MSYSYEEVLSASLNYYNGDLLAASTVAKKYLLRNKEGQFLEKTPDDMHNRLAFEFARIEKKMNPSCNEALYFQQVRALLHRFKKTVPQGSPMSGIGNPFQLQSLSNCTVIDSPEDSISGVFKAGHEIAELQKRRSGVGIDLSTLRPYGSRVNNSAEISSGVPCFSDFYSYITRMIGQKARQGALMLTLSIEHPDAEMFALMKQDFKKVTGANVSFRVTDAFMQAVENDSEFTQRWPLDVPIEEAKIVKKIRAKELWDIIVDAAWRTGDPGLLMWDSYTQNLPAHCYPGFFTLSTNPCSELGLSRYDSCRLITQNLYGWVTSPFTKWAEFDFRSYYNDTILAQTMSDGLVELELEVIKQIMEKASSESEHLLWLKFYNSAFQGRRTGLGTHALADVFLSLGLPYDSDEAIGLSRRIYETHRNASYRASVELAKARGPFPIWSWELEKHNAFIQRLPHDLLSDIVKYGRRNISNLTVAPTGSVSILSQTSSGIEPVFRFVYDRFVKITHTHLDFPVDRVDEMGDKWTKFRVVHPAAVQYLQTYGIECPVKGNRDFSLPLDKANESLKKLLPGYFQSSDEINYGKGVELQGVITSCIDHGVSKTINLPKGSTKDQVHQVYLDAWKKGIKGVTVFVDGCRDGVLVTEDQKKKLEETVRPKEIVESHAPKRPQSLPAEIFHVKVKGESWAVVVGLMNGKPFEIFAGKSLVLPKTVDIEYANIKRVSSKRYSLEIKIRDNGIEEYADLKEIYDNPEQRALTRSICRELRHGLACEFIVRDLQDNEGALTDYAAVLARVLKKYIKRVELLKNKCSECGGTEFRLVDGCSQCQSCSASKCS